MRTIKFLKTNPNAKMPVKANITDTGWDVFAAEDVRLPGSTPKAVPLGFSVEIPPGWGLQVRSRSGLALKGVMVANSPGTIDADYRGECKVILVHVSDYPTSPYDVKKGDKIAQLVLERVEECIWEEVSEINDTTRGTGGFGSTGTK
jgi:dUTP pyrophosphatase